MSRSCHRATFSSPTVANPRRTRASPETRSQRAGLRLWGMEEEPWRPLSKGSSASSTSVRCRWRISVANLSREDPITARVHSSWAWRSRCTIWLETGSTASPRVAQTCSSTSGGTLAWVPTAPEILPTAISSRARSRRCTLRRISSTHSRSLKPKVIGSACTPWLRPICGVSL